MVKLHLMTVLTTTCPSFANDGLNDFLFYLQKIFFLLAKLEAIWYLKFYYEAVVTEFFSLPMKGSRNWLMALKLLFDGF